MDRLQVAFVALLVLSLGLGGATAVDTGSTLRAVDASSFVKGQLGVTVTGVELESDRLLVRLTIENPTRLDLQLTGTRFRLHNATNERLAAGVGELVDTSGSLDPGGTLTATYAMRLSPRRHAIVEDALRTEAGLSVTVAVQLRETTIVIHREVTVGGGT